MQFKELIDSSPECSRLIMQVMTKRVTMLRDHMRENNPLRVVVVGSQYDTECRDIRSFLSLNRIPYEWVDRTHGTDRLPFCMPVESVGPFVLVDQSICVEQPITVRKVADGDRSAMDRRVLWIVSCCADSGRRNPSEKHLYLDSA
jgi:thioredoxin reductase (NADPH)